ncbi:MAG: uracil-DNA glycosylase [Deinococcota bacterium]
MTFNPAPADLLTCRLCPRLATYREEVASTKRRAYANESYWGKPVPGFGDVQARILLLGLAPGAHGSNRTGRMFTGDASGNFLFPALHRAGFASQAHATSHDDGMVLTGMFITAAARCVPPGNKPTRDEVATCRTWLEYDLTNLLNLKLVLALGSIAHDSYLEYLKAQSHKIIKKHYAFGHGNLHQFEGLQLAPLPLLDAYHVSFQNTNTGKLTEAMFDDVLALAKTLAGLT